jgi:hypothetical protein
MVSLHFHRFITLGSDQGQSKTINKNQKKFQKQKFLFCLNLNFLFKFLQVHYAAQ